MLVVKTPAEGKERPLSLLVYVTDTDPSDPAADGFAPADIDPQVVKTAAACTEAETERTAVTPAATHARFMLGNTPI
jgi:hypothetical protein